MDQSHVSVHTVVQVQTSVSLHTAQDGGMEVSFDCLETVAIFQVDPKFLSPSFGKGAHLYLRQHPGIALSPDGAADEWEDTLPSGRQVV